MTKSLQSHSTDNSNNLRRSERNKGKVIHYFSNITDDDSTDEDVIDKSVNITKSALKQHETNNKHEINWTDWNIISRDIKHYRLLVRESLAITQHQPNLNKTVSSVPLIIYPEGLQARKPKVKIKSTIDASPREERSVL